MLLKFSWLLIKMSNNSNYRWCVATKCSNNSTKTPDKIWIQVPSDIDKRKTWLEAAKRDPEHLSQKSRLYFCEDHFDLERDMENYTMLKLMGSVKRIQMKPHCVPSKFDCNRKHKLNIPHPVVVKKFKVSSTSPDSIHVNIEKDINKPTSSSVEDLPSSPDIPSMKTTCDKAIQTIEAQEYKRYKTLDKTTQAQTQVVMRKKHKAVQACRKVHYRSKEIQTGVKTKDGITSPINFLT